MTSLQDGVYITNDKHPQFTYRVDTATGKGYLIREDGSEEPVGLRYFSVADCYRVVAKPEKPKPHEIPGTLLRSPRSGNVVEVLAGGRQKYVEIARANSYRLPGDFLTSDPSPALSEWEVVARVTKTVTKTEYVPV